MPLDPHATAALNLEVTTQEAARASRLVRAERELVDALAAARRARGMTVRDVADRMGVKVSTVARLEAPGSSVRLGMVRRYAHAVGADVTYTVTINPDTPTHE